MTAVERIMEEREVMFKNGKRDWAASLLQLAAASLKHLQVYFEDPRCGAFYIDIRKSTSTLTDHLAYRCSSGAEFDALRKAFEHSSDFIFQIAPRGQRKAYVQLTANDFLQSVFEKTDLVGRNAIQTLEISEPSTTHDSSGFTHLTLSVISDSWHFIGEKLPDLCPREVFNVTPIALYEFPQRWFGEFEHKHPNSKLAIRFVPYSTLQHFMSGGL